MANNEITSSNGVYRWILSHQWDSTLPTVCWCMLNPSTKTGKKDDPTMRRIIIFSRSHGYGSFLVINLFSFRCKDPRSLCSASRESADIDIVGEETNSYILHSMAQSAAVVVAWGACVNITQRRRAKEVLELINSNRPNNVPLYCLAYCKMGQPRHPLYVKKETKMVHFNMDDTLQHVKVGNLKQKRSFLEDITKEHDSAQ